MLVLAAAILAPILGLSSKVTLLLLQALVDGGELSVGGVMKVAYALGSSMLPDGSFDEGKVLENFEQAGEMARNAQLVIEAAERAGGDKVRTAPLVGLLKKTASDASGEGLRCFTDVAAKYPNTSSAELEDILRKDCRGLDPERRKRELKKLGRSGQ